MYTVHLGTLGMVRNLQWIADIANFSCRKFAAFLCAIEQGAMGQFFLLDTV